MQRLAVRIAIVAWMLSIPFIALFAQPDAGTLALKQSVHPLAQSRYDRGPVDSSFKIGYITLMLKSSARQQAALERLLEEQQDRSSVNYHRWLTPEEFGDRFGMNRADYQRIVSWIESQGLHIEARRERATG